MFEGFWSKVNKTDSCWEWTAGTDTGGYGSIWVCGKPEQAHRVAYVLTYGAIPDGLWVLHNCPGGDNRACVRPDHLFLGTHTDNMIDMWAKGRGKINPPWGESHPFAKLTEAQVMEIRARYEQGGITQSCLASEFGISQTHVKDIVKGRKWKHLLTSTT